MKKSNQTTFTTKFINRTSVSRFFGRTRDGKKINTLMGVSGIIA